MAIPEWTWPETRDGSEARPSAGDRVDPARVDRLTDVFAVLSSGVRVEILAALHARSEPTTYTALRDATSVEDKGRFNYHLRQLEPFVRSRDGEYALTDRGEAVAARLLAEESIHRDE